ncbi:RNA-directed DNA polymerase, eukaryota [Tanacetum coccineum]
MQGIQASKPSMKIVHASQKVLRLYSRYYSITLLVKNVNTIKTIPIKVNIFAWKVSLDRLPTRSNLARRGVLVPSSSCLICNVSDEDLAHLLFRCDLAIEVTRLVYRWWNLVWIPLDSYISWLSWIKALRMNSRSKMDMAENLAGGQTCWMSIVKEVKVLKGRGVNVLDFIRLKLGNGESSSFWDDKWYEGGVIKELFPRLYALETYKNATVSMKLMASSIDHSFRRSVRSGVEESQFNSLLEIVQVTNLVPCEDRYRWFLESDGVFSVASIRKLIDEQRFQEVGLSTRWVKSVPSKVNITAWKIKTNALPTRFNLSCRGMDIDSIMCPICNGGVETTSHLFFQCELVRQIMRKISIWWNVDYADVSSYEEWLAWLVSIRIQIKLKGMMEGVFYGLWWSIWNFRNKILFEDKPPKKALLFDNLVSNSFNWCKYRCKASFKWDDWLKNPYLVCV